MNDIKREECFTDIANAIMRLRHAFMRHNMKAPVSIELGEHRDGDQLICSVPKDMLVQQPVMGRDPKRPDIAMTLMGVEIRYPAEFRAREKGGFDIV